MFCWGCRAPKKLSPLNMPATVMPVRSTKGHNDNIYFEAAQDSRRSWALLNLEKHTGEAGLRVTEWGREGQLTTPGDDGERQLLTHLSKTGCKQLCSGQCLTIWSQEKSYMVCSICQFLWYCYSYYSWYLAANLMLDRARSQSQAWPCACP